MADGRVADEVHVADGRVADEVVDSRVTEVADGRVADDEVADGRAADEVVDDKLVLTFGFGRNTCSTAASGNIWFRS